MLISQAARVTDHARTFGTSVAGTGKTITPSMRPTLYSGERGKWDADLIITRDGRGGRFQYRFGVGYVDPTGSCRRTQGGAIVPGPYAYAYGLASCIAADPRMSTAYESNQQRGAGIEHHVNDGDLIRLGGELFRVDYERDQWINLVHAGSVL